MISADLAVMHKGRPQHSETEIIEVVGEIEGKTCIIFDDMIDTAGSLVTAKEEILRRGAERDVYAVATHPIFSGPAVERLSHAGFREVVVTDSIPVDAQAFPGLTVLPIAPLLAEVIRHVAAGQSVTEIYGAGVG